MQSSQSFICMGTVLNFEVSVGKKLPAFPLRIMTSGNISIMLVKI